MLSITYLLSAANLTIFPYKSLIYGTKSLSAFIMLIAVSEPSFGIFVFRVIKSYSC